jgi:hypothetical protein
MVRRRGGIPGGFDPGDDDGSDDDDSDTGPRAPGGAPSIPGGSDPGPADPDPPDDDPDPSPGPSSPGGSPSVPGGVDPTPPDPDPDPAPGPSAPSGAPSVPGGVDPSPPDPDPVTTTIDSVEQDLTEAGRDFDRVIASPIGDIAAAVSPIAQAGDAVTGTDEITESRSELVRGGVNLVNAPAIAAGGIAAAQRAARDTRRANQEGAAGRRANRRELASDVIGAATATGRALERDPLDTTSRIAGGVVAGGIAGGAASRALRGTPDVPDAPDTPDGTVPSGRSQVGTGGRGSVLEDVDVDAERGISGPSFGSRARGTASRAVDDVTDAVGDAVDPFVPDAGETGTLRSGLVPESATERRTPDAPDDFDRRPPDAGGTFEDVRQDALTQIQDDLRGRGQRPNPGTFDDAPQPFRSGGDDTIDADGVQLQRTSGTPGTAGAVGSTPSTGFGATAFGAAAGTGLAIDPRNDPTGIADTDSVSGTRSGAASRGGTGAGSFGTLTGILGETNDPTGVAPTGDTDTGTGVGSDLGADTTAGLDSGTVGDTGTDGLGDGDTRTEPIPQLRATTTVGTREDARTLAGTPARTTTFDDPETATDVGGDGFGTRTGFGFGGTPTPRLRDGEGDEDDDEEEPIFGLAADADRIDSGISSGTEQLEEAFGIDTDSNSFLL